MTYIEDTNVISTATRGDGLAGSAVPGTNRAQLEDKRRELEEQGFRHAIAPVLLTELITGLAKSPETASDLNLFRNFHGGKDKLRFLYPWDRPTPLLLPAPWAFAIKAVLNLESPKAASLNEKDFSRWVDIVFCAQNSEELWIKGVQISASDPHRHTIDRESVHRRHQMELEQHRQLLNAIRRGDHNVKSRADFVRTALTSEGIIAPREQEIETLSIAIDAAYRYHVWILDHARMDYNFESDKHEGDPLDYAFLLYLADPGMRFLTHDRRILDRVKGSPQASQIILLPRLPESNKPA